LKHIPNTVNSIRRR